MMDLSSFFNDVKIRGDDQEALKVHGITDIDSLSTHKETIYRKELNNVSDSAQGKLRVLIHYMERHKKFDLSKYLSHMLLFQREMDDLSKRHETNPKSDKGDIGTAGFILETQGFNPSSPVDTADNPEDDLDRQDELLADEGPEEFPFHGTLFKKRHCYHFSSSNNEECVVAIRAFILEEGQTPRAVSVRVIPVSQTFLGSEKGIVYGSQYCQMRQEKRLISLSELRDTVQDPKDMPTLCYEPQKTGTVRAFAYHFDESQFTRVGLRCGKPSVIELFCGSGGMHLGYKTNGFKTEKAIDLNKDAIETFCKNNPNDAHAAECICVNKYLDAYVRDGTVGVLHASSPCQGFSKANRKGGKNDAINNELALSFTEGLRKTQALIGIFENVDGIWSEKGMPYLKRMLHELEEMKYQFRTMVIRACNYGDPQIRPRFIIFASRSYIPLPAPPVQTHFDPRIVRGHIEDGNRRRFSKKNPWVMAGDVLDLFTMVSQDKFPNMNDRKKCDMSAASYEDVVPLVRNKLSNAILASGAPVPHYDMDADGNQKSLSVRDVAALQSYPNDYEFYGTLTAKFKQVGNSVPCCLAAALAGAAANVLRFVYQNEISESSNTMPKAPPAAATVSGDIAHHENSEKQSPSSNMRTEAATTADVEHQSGGKDNELAATAVVVEEKKQDNDEQQQSSTMDLKYTSDEVVEEDVEMVTTTDDEGTTQEALNINI